MECHTEKLYNDTIGEADAINRPTGGWGDTMQKRRCWVCGAEATQFQVVGKYDKYRIILHERNQRGYCDECFAKVTQDLKESKDQYIRLRKKLMYERAVRSMERQDLDIYEYEEALKAVEEYSQEFPDKFDSSEEMIAAAVLIQNRINITIGKQIGKYIVDIEIPEMFVLLEIDGQLHRSRLYYDNERDKELRATLGGKWEVVRIKTDYINQNAKVLVDAIDAVYAEKKKLRQENNGLLPDWYSRREFAKKPKRQDYGDDFLLGI